VHEKSLQKKGDEATIRFWCDSHHATTCIRWPATNELNVCLRCNTLLSFESNLCLSLMIIEIILKFTFWKFIFQIFLCLFVIRKVNQRKTFSGQWKIWFGFQESVFPFSCICFPKSDFRETTFQTFLCLFAIRKSGQRKTLSSQRKIWLGFQESVFLKNLGGKHFPEVVKNLEMLLFADYIKFNPQTFDCYI